MDNMAKIRKHIIFTGRVQGVGFRYTASRYANIYHLTGWVKNEYDGTVSMEAQGLAANIDKLLYALVTDTYIHVDKIDSEKIQLTEDESGFKIRGY